MTPETLYMLGTALYGPRWQADLARHLGISRRHMVRLASGDWPISPEMSARVRAACYDRIKEITDAFEASRPGQTILH